MDWTGLGVIIIGLALLGVAFLLVKPLKKLTEVLSGLQQTTNELPNQIADVMADTKQTLSSANGAIQQVNEQFKNLKPVFQFISNSGTALQNLFKELAAINDDVKAKTNNPTMNHYNLEGIYGVMALGYVIFQRQKTK